MLHQLSVTKPEAFSHRFEGMPVCSNTYVHPLDPGLWCVDSEVSVADRNGCDHLFTGHAASPDRAAAVRRSCQEIVERLVATRLVQGEEQARCGWIARQVFGDAERGVLDAAAVLIREPGPDFAGASASGLAVHSHRDRAIRHGLSELIERHVALRWWYSDAAPLVRLDQEVLPDGFGIDYLTTACRVPFVLAVLSDTRRTMIFCGTAVRSTFADARAHAREECLHLAANYLVHRHFDVTLGGPQLRGNVAATVARIALLRGPTASAMLEHVARRVTNARTEEPKAIDLRDITEAALGPAADPLHVDLGRWRDRLQVVRVTCEQAVTKRDMRRNHELRGHLPDPFC